jgi:SulP family sulfate permease
MAGLHIYEDLDRALEWAEAQILLSCPPALMVSDPPLSLLGDLGADLDAEARGALERVLQQQVYSPGQTIIRQGEEDRSLLLVQVGTVTLSTSATPDSGLRLSVVGAGAVFGEMAFLNGIARTAFAHAGEQGARVAALSWDAFQQWRQRYPDAALAFITALARMGIRRLGATSQELRAAMD